MLMDNTGVGGGNAMENKPVFGTPENPSTSPMGEVPDFEEFLKQREDLKPQEEAPKEMAEDLAASVGEKASEQVSSAMPSAPAPVAADEGDEAREVLENIPIPRDAEKLPRAYSAAVVKIVNRNAKDPHKLVAEIDVARWDLMKKAFNRRMGDGLNGSQLNG